jgi:hypothetical protein
MNDSPAVNWKLRPIMDDNDFLAKPTPLNRSDSLNWSAAGSGHHGFDR